LLSRYFEGKRAQVLILKLVGMVSICLKITEVWEGRNLIEIHTNLGIKECEFERFIKLFHDSLFEIGIEEKLINEIIQNGVCPHKY